MFPADFHFLRPDWFYALIPLTLLLWWLWSRHGQRSRWEGVCDSELIQPLLTGGKGTGPRLPLTLLALGWLLAVTALAGPSWTKLPQPVLAKQQARVIVLDLSRSMDAADLKPSRLAQARFKTLDLLKAIDEGQTGLIAYAGEPFTVSPLTDDSATIAALLPSLDTTLMPAAGTRTDLALAQAGRLLQQAGVSHGQVILIGDGVAPLQASLKQARQLRADGHRLSVLAVGTRSGAPIPTQQGGFLSDHNGAIVIPRLDPQPLETLAAQGGGQLIMMDSSGKDIDQLLATSVLSLDTDTKSDTSDSMLSSLHADLWREQGPWLLLLLLPLAALGFRRGWLGVLLLGSLLPLMPVDSALAADARIDREAVLMDETLHLTLSIPGAYTGEPDFSALKHDFELLGSNRSSRINIVNGQKRRTTEWLLTLAPLHTGRLTIPAIEIGGEFTTALNVTARPAAASNGQARDLSIELSVDPALTWVQAQSILTLRIFHAVPLQDARVGEPQVGDALLQRMGEDRAYRSTRNGRQYRVIERRYALFPQHSGSLDIPAITLTAEVRVNRNGSRGSRFGNSMPFGGIFRQTRTLRVRSKPLKLEVKARPADIAASDWLPARTLQLETGWSPDPPQFRVGEPVTRTLTLTARGLSAAQLPDLGLTDIPGLRSYADRPVSEDDLSGIDIIGRKALRIALVPGSPGPLTLPGLTLNWFDTINGQPRQIQIPARQIDVLPAPTQPASSEQPDAAQRQPASDPATPLNWLPIPQPLARYGVNGLSVALALAWLLTLLLWQRSRRRTRSSPQPTAHKPAPAGALSLSEARAMLRRGCRDDDPGVTRTALLGWAAGYWPDAPPHSLGELAQRLPSGPAIEIILNVDQALYQQDRAQPAASGGKPDPRKRHWRGDHCAKTLSKLLQAAPKKVANSRPNTLPTLYPNSTHPETS